MSDLSAVPAPDLDDSDRYDGLPEDWTPGALELYAQVEEEHGDLTATQRATLFQAAALVSLADTMQEQVNRDGLMVRGSQGQPVANPLIGEIRQARAQAMTGLRALGIAPAQNGSSAAGAALARKRWHGRGTAHRRQA